MSKLIIKAEEAREIVWDDHEDWEKLEDTIVDQGRWDTHYQAIVKHTPSGKTYEVYYSKGSTEQQDCHRPFEWEDEVEFEEVEQQEKTVLVWVPVEKNET